MSGRSVGDVSLGEGEAFGINSRRGRIVHAHGSVRDVVVVAGLIHEAAAAVGEVPAPVAMVARRDVGQSRVRTTLGQILTNSATFEPST